jgi:peptidoglycan/xylan/chitin deacetylase (PgdA/CDA1 family)
MGVFRPLVLCYHAASERWPHVLSVPPHEIERQVRRLLRRGFRPASAAEVAGRPDDPRLLHITFDDAFRSVADALPRLRRAGAAATVFACAGLADTGARLAVPRLKADAETYPDELATMTWDELRAIAGDGVEIGSHTLTHPDLRELGDKDLRRELVDSRARIEDELGRPCRVLAYPYGFHDERVRAAARAAGYDVAFALSRFAAVDEEGDRYSLPRIGAYRDRGLRLRVKTSPLARSAVVAFRRRG